MQNRLPSQPTRYAVARGLSKSFISNEMGGQTLNPVLVNFAFSLDTGEFCTLFGPNGSGKTTLLNLLAGLLEPDSGEILVAGRKPAPALGAYVFQNFKDSLFPWRTVEGNLLFPLECQIDDDNERGRLFRQFVDDFKFPIPLKARVYELSVGQQQMVCLARALITRPTFILMDEPFSALDFRMRRFMQDRLLAYWRESDATILFVSHEIDEAIYLGQRVILFPPRPVTMTQELAVTLPFPRGRSVMYDQEYFRIRSEVIRFYEESCAHNE